MTLCYHYSIFLSLSHCRTLRKSPLLVPAVTSTSIEPAIQFLGISLLEVVCTTLHYSGCVRIPEATRDRLRYPRSHSEHSGYVKEEIKIMSSIVSRKLSPASGSLSFALPLLAPHASALSRNYRISGRCIYRLYLLFVTY